MSSVNYSLMNIFFLFHLEGFSSNKMKFLSIFSEWWNVKMCRLQKRFVKLITKMHEYMNICYIKNYRKSKLKFCKKDRIF